MDFTFYTLALSEIDGEDRLFQLWPAPQSNALVRSVAALGLLTPLTLQPRRDAAAAGLRFRLVRGFRRYQAALAAGLTAVPARLLPEEWDDRTVYQRMLVERSASAPLSPLEAAYALTTLRRTFACETAEIIRTWLPRMGLAPNPKLVTLYEPLVQLEPELQAALAADDLGVESASLLAAAPAAERRSFWLLCQQLRLGKNRQREFWTLLADIAAIKNSSIAELLAEPDLMVLLADLHLTPSQKSDRVRNRLLQLRYPQYGEVQARFEALLRSAKLPPQIHLRSTPWFSGEEYRIELSFTSTEEYARHLQVLQTMQERGLIAQLVQLA
ncbi:MAG TPA: ParB N-terminal domain-containing protein [bacterium]|nr:ParB N-terminal domain-containing protein [bacterium]HQG44563.1 ParB N-terminal domain-containing protein [bacterium]HQI47339.1 ParB N-terminal domain-containing protein [bacterium]HQJ63386.1 ParB N-terminal domain-containing protein [bacterium]